MKNIGKKLLTICIVILIVVGTFTSTTIAKDVKKTKKQTIYVVTAIQIEEACKIMSYNDTVSSAYKYNKNGLLKNVDINYTEGYNGLKEKYAYKYKGKEVDTVKYINSSYSNRKTLNKWSYYNERVPKKINVDRIKDDSGSYILSFNKKGNLRTYKRNVEQSDGSKLFYKTTYRYDSDGNIKKIISTTKGPGDNKYSENHEYTYDEKGNIIFEKNGYNKNSSHTLTYNEQGLLTTRHIIDEEHTYGDPGEGDPFDPRYIIDVNQYYTYMPLRVEKEYVDVIRKQQWEILNNLRILYLRTY